jgi:putative membrane protein insertion efficiency factor
MFLSRERARSIDHMTLFSATSQRHCAGSTATYREVRLSRPTGREMERPKLGRALSCVLQMMIRCYQLLISPLLPPSCRYLPSCSDYAVEAIDRHGALAGLGLALRRLARCHPWGGDGYDPVPAPRAVDQSRFGVRL